VVSSVQRTDTEGLQLKYFPIVALEQCLEGIALINCVNHPPRIIRLYALVHSLQILKRRRRRKPEKAGIAVGWIVVVHFTELGAIGSR